MARQQDNIAGVYDPDVILTQKGGLIGSNGSDPVEIPPGADGDVVVYDSTTTSGLSSRALDPSSVNTLNATNAALFKMGM